MQRVGKVYLVGAGPGDPGLLTMRAHALLRSADVVVHDAVVSAGVLAQVLAGIEQICVDHVGDMGDVSDTGQEKINRLLVDLARQGRDIVRLKCGDPFVFGRGGEEALYLRRHGIEFEVVPGVTAAAACAAYAGIPLTHAGLARNVHFISGHLDQRYRLNLDWRALADPEGTLVVYMGLASVDRVCAGLMAQGLDVATPAVVIERGTLRGQRRVFGDIATLARRVRGSGLKSPVLVVIGRTVALAGELDWFNPNQGQANDAVANSVGA